MRCETGSVLPFDEAVVNGDQRQQLDLPASQAEPVTEDRTLVESLHIAAPPTVEKLRPAVAANLQFRLQRSCADPASRTACDANSF